MAEPATPSLWWSPSRGLIERFVEGEGAYYLARGREAGQLPDDAVRLVPYRIRSYWTSQHTWTDPDCFECGGEGAPCCEPPDYPWPGEATDLTELDRLRAIEHRARCLVTINEAMTSRTARVIFGVTDAG